MQEPPVSGLRRMQNFLFAGLICSLLAFDAQAATITVNTTDNTPGAAGCSLRKALESSLLDNGAPGNGACESGNGPDTIVFDTNVFPPGNVTAIALSGDPIVMSALPYDVTIDGDQRVELAAGGASQVLIVEGFDVRVTLRGLTLSGGQQTPGREGGGIFLDAGATLSLENCTVKNNSATVQGGGIYSRDSTLIIADSIFTGNQAGVLGGAIFSTGFGSGSLTVERSRFEGNTAQSLGGALRSGVPTTITDSVITHNTLTAPGSGAGISFTLTSAHTLNNNQITNNAPGNNCDGQPFSGSGNRYWPPSDTSCPAGTGIFARVAQSITFTTTPPSTPEVGSTYVVAATGGASGNGVTLSVAAASALVCSISGSTVTFDAPGACRINANQPGNDDFDDAPQVQQIVIIGGPTWAPTPVPTLGQWALIALSAVLAGVAGARVRRPRLQ